MSSPTAISFLRFHKNSANRVLSPSISFPMPNNVYSQKPRSFRPASLRKSILAKFEGSTICHRFEGIWTVPAIKRIKVLVYIYFSNTIIDSMLMVSIISMITQYFFKDYPKFSADEIFAYKVTLVPFQVPTCIDSVKILASGESFIFKKCFY